MDVTTTAPVTDLTLKDPRVPGRIARYLICLLVAVEAAQTAVPALWTRSAEGLVTGPRILLSLAAGVFFLVWVRRCHLNAESIAPGTLRPGPEWAVLIWLLLPVLWLPRRQLLGVWRATGAVPDSFLVNAWWVAWVGNIVISVGREVLFVLSHHAISNTLAVCGAILYCAAGLLITALISRITAAQATAPPTEQGVRGPQS